MGHLSSEGAGPGLGGGRVAGQDQRRSVQAGLSLTGGLGPGLLLAQAPVKFLQAVEGEAAVPPVRSGVTASAQTISARVSG